MSEAETLFAVLRQSADAEVVAAIETLVRDGVAIVLVEQDARLAFRTVGRAYVLEAGRIAREGSSADLLADLGVQDADLGGFEA